MTVYPDTDVVISSLISKTGGAHLILHTPSITSTVSEESREEIERVMAELKISPSQWEKVPY